MREQFQVRIDRYVHRGSRKRVDKPPQNRLSDDYARLARRLCGKSVGVVMGGGGARGISHIGAIRALLEQGVPIDMVGGTSIGSFVGGLYARDADLYTTYGRAKRFSGRMSTLWRMVTGVQSFATTLQFLKNVGQILHTLWLLTQLVSGLFLTSDLI